MKAIIQTANELENNSNYVLASGNENNFIKYKTM